MRKYVAIIGSREYPEIDRVHGFVQQLSASDVMVSGLARGVDSEARRAALEHGMIVVDVPALWKHHGRGAGMRRNRIIIEIATHVAAFWDGSSRGTQNGIQLALDAGKPLKVFGPDGKLMEREAYIS